MLTNQVSTDRLRDEIERLRGEVAILTEKSHSKESARVRDLAMDQHFAAAHRYFAADVLESLINEQ